MVFTSAASYSQVTEVMVGDTEMIATLIQSTMGSCQYERFEFGSHTNLNFSYIMDHQPEIRETPHSATVFFSPHLKGEQIDSVVFFDGWECGPPGHPTTDSVHFVVTAIGLDSVVFIRIRDTNIILPIDTQAGTYKSKIEPFFFYSNIADSVLFGSWQLVIDPSAKISFTVDSSSNPILEYRSKPFTRKKQLNFTFTSALPATDTARSFPATMKTRVTYKGVDSTYSNNFTILLPAAPKSEVKSEVQNISFTVNPNPFLRYTTFTVTTPNSAQVTLEIFDMLGSRKAVITSNEIMRGSREFSFDASGLATGSYFARLVCGAQVLTRKLIIEK
jgi:hypothetical protein